MTFSASLETENRRLRNDLDAWQRAAMEVHNALRGLTMTAERVTEEVAPGHRREWLETDIRAAQRALEAYDGHKASIQNRRFLEALAERKAS